MSNLYPVEQVACVLVELAQAGIPPDVQELLVHGNPHLGVAPGALAKALTRIEAAPAVDRETLSIAIDAAISDGMKENGCVSVGQIADAIMALPPVKQSDGLAERVREACAAIPDAAAHIWTWEAGEEEGFDYRNKACAERCAYWKTECDEDRPGACSECATEMHEHFETAASKERRREMRGIASAIRSLDITRMDSDV